jgi:hypothetical protein
LPVLAMGVVGSRAGGVGGFGPEEGCLVVGGVARLRARQLTARGARRLKTDREAAEALYREAVGLDPGLHAAWSTWV